MEDPAVYINLHGLKSYTIQHLKTCLMYRGDSLKNVKTLKEAQVQSIAILQARDRKKLIDPIPNKILLSKKAKLMGLTLKKEHLKNLPKGFCF